MTELLTNRAYEELYAAEAEEYILVDINGTEIARTTADALFGAWLEWAIPHHRGCLGGCTRIQPIVLCGPCRRTAEVRDDKGNTLLTLLEADRVMLCPGDRFRLKWELRP